MQKAESSRQLARSLEYLGEVSDGELGTKSPDLDRIRANSEVTKEGYK